MQTSRAQIHSYKCNAEGQKPLQIPRDPTGRSKEDLFLVRGGCSAAANVQWRPNNRALSVVFRIRDGLQAKGWAGGGEGLSTPRRLASAPGASTTIFSSHARRVRQTDSVDGEPGHQRASDTGSVGGTEQWRIVFWRPASSWALSLNDQAPPTQSKGAVSHHSVRGRCRGKRRGIPCYSKMIRHHPIGRLGGGRRGGDWGAVRS